MTFDEWWKSEGFEFDPEAKPAKWLALYAWQTATKADREFCANKCEKYMLEQYGNHYGVAEAIRRLPIE